VNHHRVLRGSSSRERCRRSVVRAPPASESRQAWIAIRDRCARFRETSSTTGRAHAGADDGVRHDEVPHRPAFTSAAPWTPEPLEGHCESVRWDDADFARTTRRQPRHASVSSDERAISYMSVWVAGRADARGRLASPGSVVCIAGLLKSNSPDGLKQTRPRPRGCSTAVCRLAFWPARS
jgi:hypothetical protein